MQDKIIRLINAHLSVKLSEKDLSKDFIDDLGADSLDMVELVVSIEEEFNIEVDDDEAEKINTAQQVIDFVKSKLA